MPRENRTIFFDGREVYKAMEAFAARQNTPMPQGALDGMSFDPEGEPALTLTVKPLGAVMAQKIAFRKAEVAAALILFCRELHVPLPKNCRKDLIADSGLPAFAIHLD